MRRIAPEPGALALAASLAALGAALWAQPALRSGRLGVGALGFGLALAAAALAVGAGGGAGIRELLPRPVPDAATPARPGALLLALAAMACLLALQALDRAHPLQLAALFVVVAGLLRAWEPPRPRNAGSDAALLALLVAIGLLARLWDLQNVPGGLYGDEGEFGLMGLRILEGEPIGPFATGWDAHPTFFAWLQAGAMTLAGSDVAGLRLASALAGGLTVAPVFVLTRGAFGRTAGIAAALLLAASPFHGHLTRLASNNAWVCLCTAIAVASVWVGARSGAARPFVLAGIALGGCLYFGNKAVSLPPTVAVATATLALTGGPAVRRQWRLWILVWAIALVVALPQVVHYAGSEWWGPVLKHPMHRLVQVPQDADPLAFWGEQARRALLGLVAFRDGSLFRVPGQPTLLAQGEAALFTVGLGFALATVRRPGSALLLAWLSVGVFTSLFDTRPPQSHHLVAISPVPPALGGLALAALARALRPRAAGAGTHVARALLAPALVGGLLALTVADDLRTYHRDAARSWLMVELSEVGRLMTRYAPTHQLVLVAPTIMWEKNSTLRFVARGVRGYTVPAQLDPGRRWFEPDGRPVAFLLDGRRRSEIETIRSRYPHGTLHEIRDSVGQIAALAYEVPAPEAVRERRLPAPPEARPGPWVPRARRSPPGR